MKAPAHIGKTLALLAVATLGACGDSRPSADDGSGTSAAPKLGGPEGGVSEAGVIDGTTLCEDLAQQGGEIPETALRGEPPTPIGGTIQPGTYVLSELNVYVPTTLDPDSGEPAPVPPSEVRARGTLVVTSKNMRFFEARQTGTAALPPDTPQGLTYISNGLELELTPLCPARGERRAIGYSAVGNGLALLVDPTHRELYVRVR